MLLEGQIYRSSQRKFYCKLLQTNSFIYATALGNLLKEGPIVVGDYVSIQENCNNFSIVKIHPRKSSVFRISIRENKKKIMAANCDALVIVISAIKPKFKRGILERYILRSYQWDLQCAVVFNKMDLYNSKKFDLCYEVERLKYLDNLNFFEISAVKKDYKKQCLSQGICELKNFLKNKTSLFQGQSGVGKSSLIQTLTDGEFELKRGEIGKINKGTHTTTWSELIDYKDLKMVDSPGIRSFSIEDIRSQDLICFFPDLEVYAAKCQFRNCLHQETSKGCAFYNDLNYNSNPEKKEIILSRLESYKNMLLEISKLPEWSKKDYY